MKFLIAFSCLLAIAAAKPGLVNPLAYSVAGPAYGYSNIAPLAYSSYSSSIAHGAPLVHSSYVAPYAHHSIVAAAPVVRSSVVAAPVAHSSYVATAPVVQTAPIAHTSVVATAPVVRSSVVAAPVAHSSFVATAPVVRSSVVATAPVAGIEKIQYHAQNELGQASYGHSEAFQAHNAVQDAAGNKAGSYSYVAPDGQVIAANYVADSLGYRVSSNALPVAPAALPIAPAETPEVAAARLAHLQEHALVHSRARRGIYTPLAYSAPLIHHAAIPVAYSAVASPVVHPATLTTVVNNPGYAVSYRVD